MKGIVFSEFVEMVEEAFSPEIADKIIDESDLPSGGAYTSVGTYDHVEILQLVTALSEATGVPVDQLVQTFGKHLAGRFFTLYPGFFEGVDTIYDFLESIEDHVHKEVRKLYPDAELPTFETERPDAEHMRMVYRSRRPFADLAEGLIQGCASHFDNRLEIAREDTREGEMYVTTFAMTKAA